MTKHKQHQNLSQPRDGGYTIIESLVAMIVVSVLMIAIAPVMAFSVATRVQARRTELATQAARTYIDALRTGAIASPVPGPAGRGFPIKVSTATNVADARVPTASDKPQNLYPIDMDGGGFSDTSSTDFYVQGAWRNPSDPPDPTKTGYELMVRVYRADSFAGGVTLRPPKDAKQSVVGGLGDKTIPVVEMTTQIPRTTGETSAYESLCARLKGTTGGCQ